MADNLSFRITKYLFNDIIGNILYFPLWWYSAGLKKFLDRILSEVENFSDRFALRLLIKNLFRPMYGDYTKSGRIISFFMRIIQLLVFLAAFLFWMIFLFLGLIIWILFPPFAVFNIFYQLF